MADIARVGVVGCGQMGAGIAEVCARSGLEVKVAETTGEALEIGRTRLQNSLFKNGVNFKADPTGSDIYGIAGFASLHVSVVVTACLFFSRTGQRLAVRMAGWVFLATTVLATIYFGWHYIADDIAGAIIAFIAFYIGGLATGQKFDEHGRHSHPTTTTSEVPVEREDNAQVSG